MPDSSLRPLKEREKEREEWREREGVTERDIDRDEVCVSIGLGMASQRAEGVDVESRVENGQIKGQQG